MSAFRRTLLASAIALVPFTLSLSAHSQSESRYGAWSPPGTTSSQAQSSNTEALLKDLKTLVDEAEKARAADRLFLRDLRDLMARYDRPWTERILFDDFSDGEFKTNPAWSVSSGEFWVEQGYGLRSKTAAGSQSSTSASTSERQISREELAISILGAVLQGANKNGSGSSSTTTTAPTTTPSGPAVLSARTRISNAFALTSTFSSWSNKGDYSFAVTQGNSGAGYRVTYTPSQTAMGAKLELVRVTSRGEGVIDSVSLDALEDKKNHTLDWSRDTNGRMVVSIDGKVRLSMNDRSFRDPFDAVAMRNGGADVIVKSIAVMGMK